MTLASKPFVIAAFAFALCCSCDKHEAPPPPAPAKPAPAPVAVVPAPAEAAPAPAPEPPPRKVVQGEGITITETASGSVKLKTTALWNEAFDITYQDCTYYLGAVPVLKRQILPERAKLLEQICVPDKKGKKAAPKAAVSTKPAAIKATK